MAVLDPGEPFEHDPFVEGVDEGDERPEWDVDAESLAHGRERLRQHRLPLGVHPCKPLLQLWTIPGERLQLEPDLLIRKVLVEIGHRRPPLHEERHVRRIHLALPLDEPFGKPFEHAHEQLLHGAEVVVDEAVIRPGLLGDLAGCDPARADLDEQPLSGVEERLLRLVPGTDRWLRHTHKSFD